MRRERKASPTFDWLLLLLAANCAVVNAAPPTGLEEMFKADGGAGEEDANVALVKLSKSSEESVSSSDEENVSDDLILLTRKVVLRQPGASSSEELLPPATQAPPAANVTPIDMSAFVALIPVRQVQAIVSNYYRQDREVQRACAFLSSETFAEMRQQIPQLPEVRAFTHYLNASGLDVVKLAQNVANAVKPTADLFDQSTITTANGNEDASKDGGSKELSGLHGLVDSVLLVLPQDQILATFFDKTETDQQFSKLVDSIGTPQFSKILSNLQNSVPFRNLIHELHNNRIHIARIVESLKEYFLLASF